MRVTLNDIAAKVGVTKTAISLALRDSPSISPAMREKIQRVAGEMGYVADPVLQRLAKYRWPGETAKVQSVIAWLNHWNQPEELRRYHEFEQYWRGAKRAAKRLGYDLEDFVWPQGLSGKLATEKLLKRGVMGLLIPPHKSEVDWGDFEWSKFSLMRFGLTVRQVDSNLVTADHQRAMVMAVKKIYDHGYRRVGLVYNAAHDRLMGGNIYGGFLWALTLLDLPRFDPTLAFDGATSSASNMSRFKAWVKKFQPDAILTTEPKALVLLRELGLRIPRDVAVAGTSLYDIPVDAGIDQCSGAIGEIAAEMLIKQINLNERGEPATPCRILVESRWRDGESMPPS